MNRITFFVRTRRFLIACLVLVAILAVPLVALAADDEPNERPESVADCEARAAGHELPNLTEFLDELVTDSTISQTQADEIEVRARERGEYRCEAHLLFPKRSAITATGDVTDTSKRAVIRALRDGATLVEYAGAHGIGEADLIAAIMAGPHEKAAKLVGSGELTQEEADELLATIERYVGELIHVEGLRGIWRTRW